MKARKKKPYPFNAKRNEPDIKVEKSADQESSEKINIFAPISKSDEDKRIVTGVVLEPETVDAQGDTIPASVIEKAAHHFLSGYNVQNTLGFAHKVFKKNFDLLESYIAPQDMTIGKQTVKAGSWVMSVKVLSEDVWSLVRSGKITGFSIGGRAKSRPIKE